MFATLALVFALAAEPAGFADFLAGLWPEAKAEGVSAETFANATQGLHYNARIAAHTEVQAEFSVPLWTYLAGAVLPARVAAGAKLAAAERETLERARKVYGVDPSAIMGAWGIETEFGAFSGGENVLNALATLGFIHYQGDLGRNEFLAALKIVQAGDQTPQGMRGSWAGAMGQPQFMPSSFLAYAVDFDGDGKRDIWRSKADAMGSIANFLKQHGWTPDLPWAVEVSLPAGYRFEAADFSGEAEFAAFKAKGVKGALPETGKARLYFPAGASGPILLVTHNFDVIKTYNNSNAYVMAVGLLGDAIAKGVTLKTPWPVKTHALTREELKRVQSGLKAQGYEIGEIDGRAGPKLEQAVRAYQFARGLVPDGYAGPAFLEILKP